MLSLEQIIEMLSGQNLSEVCRRTGLSYPTIHEIVTGKRKSPTYKTIQKIVKYLEESK